jgi:hypothetical protein
VGLPCWPLTHLIVNPEQPVTVRLQVGLECFKRHMEGIFRIEAGFHLNGADAAGAEHSRGPLEHLQIVSLSIDLQEVDPFDAMRRAKGIDCLDFDYLAPVVAQMKRSRIAALRQHPCCGDTTQSNLVHCNAPDPTRPDPCRALREWLEAMDLRTRKATTELCGSLTDVRTNIKHDLWSHDRHQIVTNVGTPSGCAKRPVSFANMVDDAVDRYHHDALSEKLLFNTSADHLYKYVPQVHFTYRL